jgi:hypothetical protein
VVLALFVWPVPTDLALALSAFERVCTMPCAGSPSCCCNPKANAGRRSESPFPEMTADDGASCRRDCAQATIVVRGNSHGRSPVPSRTPADGTSTHLTSSFARSPVVAAPLDRFSSRAPPSALAVT